MTPERYALAGGTPMPAPDGNWVTYDSHVLAIADARAEAHSRAIAELTATWQDVLASAERRGYQRGLTQAQP